MSNSVIRSALETTLLNWAAAQNPVIPVAKENSSFTKPTTGNFLEIFLLPATTINPTVAGIHKRHIGIFQVNCWTRSGSGPKAAEDLSKSIIDLYPVVPKSGVVSIEQTPSAEKPLMDISGWFIIPVTIPYRYEG